ncbi:hypothetical protein [Lusitaniella coriacea]|uniref:hypothetical protein n=1 Tax=Lusitaniella coriacea TaxID=1983105 RepID=UPI003CE9D18A
MTVDTLNTLLFPPFLFVVLFSFACCLLSSPPQHSTAPGANFAAYGEAFGEAGDPPPELGAFPTNQAAWNALEQLSKRKARQLCAPLGIQQKCQGVELSAPSMVAVIREKFKERPDFVAALIRDRFPELLGDLASPC